MFDPVNRPSHYTDHPSGVECITVTEHFNFNRGNAIKYIWRAGNKGNEVEDLRKAAWYLQREIERLESAKELEPIQPADEECACGDSSDVGTHSKRGCYVDARYYRGGPRR